jgi:hypothetical protein
MIRLYCGFDPREAIGFYTFVHSVIENTKSQVQYIPLYGDQKDGTNAFTYQRFRVPELCGFSGWAIFVDACDMLARGDVGELWDMRDQRKAVQVVKHDYQTRHPRKYLGTELEAENKDYPRKNWSSVILWNCGHRAHQEHRDLLRGHDGSILHRFSWLDDEEIGELPSKWNWLADEYGPNDEAKLLHWTAGIPGFYQYRNAAHAEEWKATARKVTRGMG